MNNEEDDKNPNAVSNQDMREFKSSKQGIKDSGGLTEADIELSETKSGTSVGEDRGDEFGGAAFKDES